MLIFQVNFKVFFGKDFVIVDLNGFGKGEVWINGQSIGCYWLSFNFSEDGCIEECDYCGEYGSDKCVFMCGKLIQRW